MTADIAKGQAMTEKTDLQDKGGAANDVTHTPAPENVTCPICESTRASTAERVMYDDRYGYPGKYTLHRCCDCGHRFLGAQFSSGEIQRLYSDFYPRAKFSLDDYQPRRESSGFDDWLKGERSAAYHWVPRNVRVLDIGCGFGETLGYHKARGCTVSGVEADENIRRVAERFGYDVHVGLFDASVYEPESFDWVTMDQVLEHIQRPVEVLAGIAKILKPGGHLVISLPNASGWGAHVFGRRWMNWHSPYHLQFFSKRSMRHAAHETGFAIETTRTTTSSGWLQLQWGHMLAVPQAGEPSRYWNQTAHFEGWKGRAFRLLNIGNRYRLYDWITRLFDQVGLGDNRLYLLRKL
jgi:2-polyprenyl-3-methyl-5-hydroxy-6-metoxy-1,4-benzoquinol methylase